MVTGGGGATRAAAAVFVSGISAVTADGLGAAGRASGVRTESPVELTREGVVEPDLSSAISAGPWLGAGVGFFPETINGGSIGGGVFCAMGGIGFGAA